MSSAVTPSDGKSRNVPRPSTVRSGGNSTGASPLWTACFRNNIERVKSIVDNGEDLNSVDLNGRSPLWISSYKGNLEIAKFLSRCDGIELEKGDIWENRSPLYVATTQGYIDIMEVLLDRGVDANSPNKDGMSPLCAACSLGDYAAVNVLLNRGANPVQQDKSGHNASMIAKKCGFREIYRAVYAVEERNNRANITMSKGYRGNRRMSTNPVAKMTLDD